MGNNGTLAFTCAYPAVITSGILQSQHPKQDIPADPLTSALSAVLTSNQPKGEGQEGLGNVRHEDFYLTKLAQGPGHRQL